jgi:diguanylate cyclase (GGDEF)-like protein/PAS domain S-box-containing protein
VSVLPGSALAQAQRLIQIRSDEVLLEIDRDWVVVAAAGFSRALWGLTAEEITGQPVLQLVHPDDRGFAADELGAMTVEPDQSPSLCRIVLASGEERWIEASGRIDPTSDHGLLLVRDVTEDTRLRELDRILMELATEFIDAEAACLDERLQQAVERLGRLLGVNRVLLSGTRADHLAPLEFEWSSDGVPSARSYTPLTATDVPTLSAMMNAGRTVVLDTLDALDPRECDLLKQRGVRAMLVTPIRRSGSINGYLSFTQVDAERVWDARDCRAAETFAVIAGQALARRCAERRRIDAETELARRALHDPLTGLPNRASLLTSVGKALAQIERRQGLITVLAIDLDRFKMVNDALGHDLGDEFLVTIARRLQGSLRGNDNVARLSADEFAVVLHDCPTPRAALSVAERTLALITQPMELAGQEYFTTASVGVAMADDPELDAADLLRWANSALHRAKDRGRNRVELFDVEMQNRVRGRVRMETALRQGMERNELDIFVQPEVDLADGTVLGVEALVRWTSPEYGLLAAGAFIDIAEETGLIVPIGGSVLRAACGELAGWMREFPDTPLVMRVNVSAKQLAVPGLPQFVGSIIDDTGIDPSALCLEITETALMTDPDAGLATLRELHELGLSLALDDFGTGYSSLSYLKRFPIDVMKIDRSFVDGLPFDRDDHAIASTIVRLAEALEMEVTAEGVETAVQAESLLALGVRRAQGYLFSTPIPTAEFASMLRTTGGALKLPLVDPLTTAR